MNKKWIEIARTGRYTAMNGEDVEVTPALLDGLAASFDEAKRRVPLVFGHPQTDSPAFGWVSALKRQGALLLASFRETPREVKELVAAGRFKNVSIKIGPDNSLWHVGLLGATQPAIPGLAPVSFGADAKGTIIEFATQPQPQKEQGMDPEAMKKEIEELKKRIAELTTALNAATSTAAETEKAFAAFKGDVVCAKREQRFAALVKSGKVLPAKKGEILAFAAALGNAKTIEFAAGDGTSKKVEAEEAFWKNLEGGESHGLFKEFAAPAQAPESKPLNLKDINKHA